MKFKLMLAMAAALLTLSGIAEPKVNPVTGAELKKMIAARKGKVVLVNLWATWCGPCVEEFPYLVKLYNKHHKKGLEVIAVSLDQPDELKSSVIPFLRKQKANFTATIVKEKDLQDFADTFDPNWSGAIPRSYLYNRSGKLVKTWTGGQTYEAFEKATLETLKKK